MQAFLLQSGVSISRSRRVHSLCGLAELSWEGHLSVDADSLKVFKETAVYRGFRGRGVIGEERELDADWLRLVRWVRRL